MLPWQRHLKLQLSVTSAINMRVALILATPLNQTLLTECVNIFDRNLSSYIFMSVSTVSQSRSDHNLSYKIYLWFGQVSAYSNQWLRLHCDIISSSQNYSRALSTLFLCESNQKCILVLTSGQALMKISHNQQFFKTWFKITSTNMIYYHGESINFLHYIF